jgi:hypothetical protein
MIYDFTLKIDCEFSDQNIDALYLAGCRDALLSRDTDNKVFASFSRSASSLTDAIVEARENITWAGFGLLAHW